MRILNLLLLFSLANIVNAQYFVDSSINYSNYRDQEVFQEQIDPDVFYAEKLNACLFYATNEIRAEKGLPILKYHIALEVSASTHSLDMVRYRFFSHANFKNKYHREPEDRARLAGITNPHIAENIIEGFIKKYTSGDEVIAEEPGVFIDPETNLPLENHTYLSLSDELIKQWMNSKGHRANILSEDALELGCGTALYYKIDFNKMPSIKATQNFQWYEKVSLIPKDK